VTNRALGLLGHLFPVLAALLDGSHLIAQSV
jgi:hypothetical protein